jgi:hypothetical protein
VAFAAGFAFMQPPGDEGALKATVSLTPSDSTSRHRDKAAPERYMSAMTLRPPRPSPVRIWDSPAGVLDYEIAQEKASALGRLGRALEQALAALARFDEQHPRPTPLSAEDRAARATLVAQAGSALWHFIVQREACGLRDARAVMRDYRVPADVQARMGAFPARPASSKA